MGVKELYMIDYDIGYGRMELTPRTSMQRVCEELCVRLKAVNCLDFATKGYFDITYSPFKNRLYRKRYVVDIPFPKMKFRIRKVSSGDIDEDTFTSTLKNIKEYYEKF